MSIYSEMGHDPVDEGIELNVFHIYINIEVIHLFFFF